MLSNKVYLTESILDKHNWQENFSKEKDSNNNNKNQQVLLLSLGTKNRQLSSC